MGRLEPLGSGDPQRIGAYRLLGRLGAGGMGQVYLARSERGRTVAVKLVRQELAEQEEFRSRFRQEVRAARQVGGAWTAPVLDADTDAEIPWVATGYVAGPSLQQVVSHDYGALPERSVRILAAGLAHALQDIHEAGLIHRDLKPSNVLVTIDGPRVIDFGIARALETVAEGGLTRTGALVGSPGFMAPEQVRGDRITPACDVFCLGSVLAYAATGALPFGTSNSGVHAMMFRIAQEEPDLDRVPEGLRDLVRDCLRKQPSARPGLREILERTGAEDTLGDGGRTRDPWLPGALVAQLGRQAVQLLDSEDPDQGPRPAPEPPGSAPAPTPGPAAAPAPAPTPGPGQQGAPGPVPPPGQPGGAQLDHLPTMVVGQEAAAPPAPAPAPPAYGYPSPHPPHPQPAAYGYPQGNWGQTPPYGPAPLLAPRQEPPRRGRSTAALIAVALIVAVGAGGSVFALMKDDGTAGRKAGRETASASVTAPERPGSGAPSPTPSPSGEQERTPQSGSGAIPTQFLGSWDRTDNGVAYRLTIQQGGPGETVLSMTADGSLASGVTYRCVFQGSLVSADPDSLSVGRTGVVSGPGAPTCTPGAASTFTVLPSGQLSRVMTTGKQAVYDRAG